MKNFLLNLLLISVFLPYFKLTPFNSDIQPYYLLFIIAFALVCINKRVKTLPFALFVYTLIVSPLVLLLASPNEFFSIIQFAFIVFILNISTGSIRTSIIFNSLKVVMFVLLLGAISNLLFPLLNELLVSNFRGNEFRWISSFASEASFYGFIGFSLLVLFDCYASKQNRAVYMLLSWLLIFSSGSLAAILPALCWELTNRIKEFKSTFFLLGITLISVLLIKNLYSDSRIGSVITDAGTGVSTLITIDESISNRLLRGIGPTIYGIQSYLIPNHVNEINNIKSQMPFSLHGNAEVSRISNTASILIYVLGMFSLPILFMILFMLSRGKGARSASKNIIYFISVLFALLSPATPYIPVTIALLIRYKSSFDSI